MKLRLSMLLVSLSLLVAAVACDEGGSTAPMDAGTPPPDLVTADAQADVPPDVTPDVSVPPPETHRVPVGPVDLTFHVGPHLMHTTTESVTVVWESEQPGSTRLEYGRDERYGQVVTGPEGTMHEVAATGLKPATIYHYRACTNERCTADLSFSTPPLPGQKFRFVVYGDSRSDPVSHGAVADMIVESAPSVVINVGDIVASGEREQFKIEHFDPTRRLGQHVPIYVAIGNHEWKESDGLAELDVPNFREYLAFPKDPAHRKDELSYSFTWGDAFFLILDNTVDGGDIFFPLGTAEPPLAQWLREQVESEEAHKAKWRFAAMHYPPGSPCHEDWANVVATRDHVVPLLRENGFHALFTGHVHDYERQDWDGFPVIITGGGGASLEECTECTGATPELVEQVCTYHHVTVDLGDETAHVRAINLDGEVFDELTIQH